MIEIVKRLVAFHKIMMQIDIATSVIECRVNVIEDIIDVHEVPGMVHGVNHKACRLDTRRFQKA